MSTIILIYTCSLFFLRIYFVDAHIVALATIHYLTPDISTELETSRAKFESQNGGYEPQMNLRRFFITFSCQGFLRSIEDCHADAT